MLTQTQKAMRQLASRGGKTTAKKHGKGHMSKLAALGGKANIRKHGKGHMSKIAKRYWKSPAGQKRRSKLSAK